MHSVPAHISSLRRAQAVDAVRTGCDPWCTPSGVQLTGEDRRVILLALRSTTEKHGDLRYSGDSRFYSRIIEFAHVDLLNCDQFAIDVATEAPLALLNFGRARRSRMCEVLADNEIVEAAVKRNGWFLQFADPSVRDSYQVVMAAVKNDGAALRFASERLRDSRPVVWEAVASARSAVFSKCPRILDYASARLRQDPEISLRALRALALAGPVSLTESELCDKTTLLCAVRNGLNLLDAPVPEWAMRDEDVVWQMMLQDCVYDPLIGVAGEAERIALVKRFWTTETVLECQRKGMCCTVVDLHFDLLESSSELVLIAMEQDLWTDAHYDFFVQSDAWNKWSREPDMRMAALRGRPSDHIDMMLPEQYDDAAFVLDLLRRVNAFSFARVYPLSRAAHGEAIAARMNERLWRDRNIALELVRCCPHSLHKMPHFASDRELAMEAVLHDDTVIHSVHADLLSDEDFVLQLASAVPTIVLKYPPLFAAKACSVAAARNCVQRPLRSLVRPEFLHDVDVLVEATKHDPSLKLVYLSNRSGEHNWRDPDFLERYCRSTGMRSLPLCPWVYEPPAVGVACLERLVRVAMELPRQVRKTDVLVRKALDSLLWAYATWAHRAVLTPERMVPASVVAGMLCLDSESYAPVGEAFAETVTQTCYALGREADDAAEDALVTLATEFCEDHPSTSLLAEQVVALRHRPLGADGEFTRAHKRARALFEAGEDAA